MKKKNINKIKTICCVLGKMSKYRKDALKKICEPEQLDFIDWWYGTYETGKMTHRPTYQEEEPLITNDLDVLLSHCTSLRTCRVSAIVQREVNASTFLVGRLSDGRFLFVQNDNTTNSSVIVIAPRCGPPIEVAFRTDKDNGDIACSLSAVKNVHHKELMTNGCLAYVLNRPIVSICELFKSIPFK